MPSNWDRRRFLHTTGSALGVTVLSGCLFGLASEHPAGTLVITNDHSEEHTVTFTVRKTSDDEDDIRRHDQTPSSETSPIWEREEQFMIGAGKKEKQDEFISETGAFYLEALLENGERDSDWVGFYDAADGGIAEDVIFVDIEDDARVNLYATHSD